jgi:UDP-N-acetylmuramoylalanine--D-glutamate ligase
MKMKDWDEKHLVIVGAARQGLALAKFLSAKGARVTITDQKDDVELQRVKENFNAGDIEWALGGHPFELLDTADIISISGGVPLDIPFIKEAVRRNLPLTNDSQVFMDLAPCPVVGITGSAGKTTTTLFVGKIVEGFLGSEHCWVGGNIGNPLIIEVDKIQPNDIAVVELSSFQLELMTTAPRVACILNITPNHLDRHKTMEEYTRAKARILTFQGSTDTAVLNREDPGSWNLSEEVKGSLISFGLKKPESRLAGTFMNGDMVSFTDGETVQDLFNRNEIQLRGEHNLLNALAASAVAIGAGLPAESIQDGIGSLDGVEHRLEFIRTYRKADWYNDSIATAPERSIAAINSFQEPLVLLAGGRDKDLPWRNFVRLVHKRIRYLVLFGEAADLIEDNLLAETGGQGTIPYLKCGSLKEAVQKTEEIVEEGDVVLLSPGGTSFDEFIDFAERGEQFKKWVLELS